MKRIFFVTSNKAKVPSARRVLGEEFGITVVHVDYDLPELQAAGPAEVARKKVVEAWNHVGQPVMVADSGFVVKARGGFPGTNVKQITEQIQLDGYLKLLEDKADRTCSFVDVFAYYDGRTSESALFTRYENGTVAHEASGDPKGHKSLVACIFIPDGCDKTLASMTPDELLAYRTRPETSEVYRQIGRYLKKQ